MQADGFTLTFFLSDSTDDLDLQGQDNRSSTGSRYRKYCHQHSQTRHLNMSLPIHMQQNYCYPCRERTRHHRNLSLPIHMQQESCQNIRTRQHSRSLPPGDMYHDCQVVQHRSRAIKQLVKSTNNIVTREEELRETLCLVRQRSLPCFNTDTIQGLCCNPQIQGCKY